LTEKLHNKLAKIRKRSQDRVGRSAYLHVDDSRVSDFAKDYARMGQSATIKTSITQSDLGYEQQIGLALMFSVINYCFVEPYSNIDYAYDENGVTLRRSTALLHALIKSGVDWSDFKKISQLENEQWRTILRLNNKNTVLFDADVRIKRLVQFSAYLSDRVGNTSNFFRQFNDAESVYRLLTESNLYDDIYLKRIQIVLLWLFDISIMFGGDFLINCAELTAMADYRLPQALCHLGLIQLDPYARTLLDDVINDRDFEEDMRAATIVVCEKVSKLLGINDAVVDGIFWDYSQKILNSGVANIPAMRVATRCY
jgi:hypothetical protein